MRDQDAAPRGQGTWRRSRRARGGVPSRGKLAGALEAGRGAGREGRALCPAPPAGASLVVQQQHDRVQLPAGPVVGSQRHDEVVQPVARRLGRHDNQLVLEAVGLGVLVAVVPAALQGRCRKPRWLRWQSLAPLGPGAPGRQPLGPGPLAACTSPTRLLCAGLGLLRAARPPGEGPGSRWEGPRQQSQIPTCGGGGGRCSGLWVIALNETGSREPTLTAVRDREHARQAGQGFARQP